MKQQLEEEAKLRRYLLGELTLEERVLVEERLFLDDDYAELAQSVEDDLADEYAHHDLEGGEREQFESHFLARPEHLEDVRIAQALKRYIDSQTIAADRAPTLAGLHPAPDGGAAPRDTKERRDFFLLSLFRRRPALSFSLAALIILSVITWFAIRPLRGPDAEPPLQAQDSPPQHTGPSEPQREQGGPVNGTGRGEDVETVERRGGDQGTGEGNKRPGPAPAGQRGGRPRGPQRPDRPAPTGVATFTIFPGGVARGAGGSESVSVAADVGTVILRLPVVDKGEYGGYRASLKTGGRTVQTFSDLTSEADPTYGKVVPVTVPAKLLGRRTYQIILTGISADGAPRNPSSYTFRVENR